MLDKHYMSRADTRAMSAEHPIGDPTGGAAYGERNDPVTATVIAGGAALGGGLLSANASQRAAQTQADAANYGANLQNQQFQQTRQDLAPYREVGQGALYQLRDMTKPGGALMQRYTGAELATDPGFQFGLDQGRNVVEQGAAARGVLFSGKTLQDLMRFGSDYGGTKFNEGFTRDMQNKQFQQGTLAGLSGTGQSTAMAGGQLGAQNAQLMADLIGSGAAASAAGRVGSANAISGALSNAGNAYMQMSMLDRIMGPRGTPAATRAPSTWSGPGMN
jgi:hypothetical protein